MADYTELKNAVRSAIKNNGKQEITGDGLQAVLLKMIDNYPEGGGEGGATSLGGLSDVNVTSAETGDALVFNGKTWTAGPVAGTRVREITQDEYDRQYSAGSLNENTLYVLRG